MSWGVLQKGDSLEAQFPFSPLERLWLLTAAHFPHRAEQ
jgi:hypothetical protein